MLLVVNYVFIGKAYLYSNDRFVDSILSIIDLMRVNFECVKLCAKAYYLTMDWHLTASIILFRSMDQACCIVYNEQNASFTRVQAFANNRLQGKSAENHCATATKYISTSLA